MTDMNSAVSRRNVLKFAGAFGAAAAFAGTLSACSSSDSESGGGDSASSPAPGTEVEATAADAGGNEAGAGAINAAISYELGTNGYDPMTTTAALTLAANWHTMEGLTEIHPATRETYAALGADLPEQIDDTTWEVTLRDGAVFHDGSPVTVEDVVFSFDRVMNPDNNSLYTTFIPFLDSVTAKDDTTVTVKTLYPFSLVAERLSVVKIVPQAVVEADATAFDLNPIGSGPFRMVDNGASSQRVVFERNDDYTGSHPAKVATMAWEIIPDDSTRTNALASDAVQAIDSVPAANLATLGEDNSVAAVQGFGLVFIMFNNGKAPMDDVRNRQAIMYALEHERISEVGMSGLATPATCFVQQEHPAYAEASVQYPTDLEQARALLAETGLTSVRLLATDHGFFSGARPIIKESIEAAGLQVEYQEMQSSDAYASVTGDIDAFDIMVAPGDPSVFGDDADLLLRWWYAADVWTEDRMHWKGQDAYNQVQELLDAASQTTGDEQEASWHEIFDLVSEEVPLYPLFHRKTPTAYDAETLVDFQPIQVTGLSFVDVDSSL